MDDVTDPARLGVLDAARALRARELSAAELLDACLRAIAQRNGGEPTFDGAPDAVNAWVRLYPEQAAEQSRAADRRLAREGEDAPLLCGIPLGLKDLYGVAGLPLTASSRVLDGHVATVDATAWQRLRERGMVLVGHLHTHEFAAGGTTDQVGNPWALEAIAGGSSGGSAAALAAGMVPVALGTDTCGSLRIPAALCGVSAIKPTHGRVPLEGVLPLAATLDHAGPMARSVADAGAVLGAMAADGAQVSPLMAPPAPLGELPRLPRPGATPLAGLTIAVTDRTDAVAVDPDVADGFEHARAACQRLGARIVSLPAAPDLSGDQLSAILLTEMAAHHRPYADRREHYRVAIGDMIDAGRHFQGAAAYLDAQQARVGVTAAWERWFSEHGVDALLEPTIPVVAWPRGAGYDRGHGGGDGDPLISLTVTWDHTGFPVIALPSGLGTRSGLPVGVSLVGPRGAEAGLVQIALDLQAGPLPPLPPPA